MVSHSFRKGRYLRKSKIIHTFRDGESRAPLVTQNVEADAAVGVDVGVVDPGVELDLWRLERVIRRELNLKEENTTRVRRIGLLDRLALSQFAMP